MDIYEIAEKTTEELKRYHPTRLKEWVKPYLEEFDNQEIGTKRSLADKRCEYEELLKKRHKEYASQMHTHQGVLMDEFQTSLADYFLSGKKYEVPQSVADRIYGRAWEEGHSSGLSDVVTAYGELAGLVTACIDEFLTLGLFKKEK